MRWEERPRQRAFDGVDAGYRVSTVLVGWAIWSAVLALVLTNPDRGPEWVIVMLTLTPLLVAQTFFAGWTVLAYVREQRWRRARELAERQGEHATTPLRGSWQPGDSRGSGWAAAARRDESPGEGLARSRHERNGGVPGQPGDR